MTLAEAIENTQLHRIGARTALVTARPCRASHHTLADVGLIGGQVPMPGGVSLARHGILFLDELPEFRRHGFGVLRQPLEHGVTEAPPLRRPRPRRAGGIGRASAGLHRIDGFLLRELHASEAA
jgi:Magnesium chelatase, subunit ChlI